MPDQSAGLPVRAQSPFGGYLIAYSRSGWAFLIPYLAAYLLYAGMKWPVHESGSGTWMPPLLHVYWLLHALHLWLGGLALRTWWRTSGPRPVSFLDRLRPLLPWLCLGLIFYIPGVYLEFPADPWEHYARINHWRDYPDITSNPVWTKSSYFLAYSLIGWIAPTLRQLAWADAYHTACCLLLCWQYYRLARVVGLGERASMVFVLLQSLLLGNNLFGFYRYYGLSSTLFAQLGALALIRLALATAQACGTRDPANDRQPAPRRSFLAPALGALALLVLTVSNHPQGLGIAAMGLAAVVAWRLIEWRRSMLLWLALAAVVLSVAMILWYPRHPVLDAFNRPQGWLTSWYGFNLFSSTSPAYSRAVEIIGLGGLINLIGGLLLLRRNHIAGWLTIMPVLVLSLPCFAIPFASLVAPRDELEIQLFNRMLLSVPVGLALIVLGVRITRPKPEADKPGTDIPRFAPAATAGAGLGDGHRDHGSAPGGHFWLVLAALCLLVLAPASSPSFNRLYHILLRPPADLSMHHVLVAVEIINAQPAPTGPHPAFLATPGVLFVAYSSGLKASPVPIRPIYALPATKATWTQDLLGSAVRGKTPALFLPLSAFELYTPSSPAGYLSLHWQPNEVALEHALRPEIERMATNQGYRQIHTGPLRCYFYSPN